MLFCRFADFAAFAVQAWCAYGLVKFNAVLDNAGPYLTDAERESAVSAGYLFLQKYMALARANLSRARCCYKVRPKFHVFHHVLHDIDLGATLNPRLFACGNDEQTNGKSTRCSKNLHPLTMGRRMLQRWLAHFYCKVF